MHPSCVWLLAPALLVWREALSGVPQGYRQILNPQQSNPDGLLQIHACSKGWSDGLFYSGCDVNHLHHSPPGVSDPGLQTVVLQTGQTGLLQPRSAQTLSHSLSCLLHPQRKQGAGRFCPDTPLRLCHERFELQPHGDRRPSLDGLWALVYRPGFALGLPPLAPQDRESLHVAGQPSLR